MNIVKILLMATIFSLMAGSNGYAKTLYFGNRPEIVPVQYGKITILRFDEPVKTITNASDFIVKPLDQENPDYSMLSIEARIVEGKREAVFLLSSGEHAKLTFSVVPKTAGGIKEDQIYDIKSKQALIENRDEALPYVGKVELMTAIIRDDKVIGYDVVRSDREAGSGVKSAKVILKKVYEGPEYNGYVYEIRNLSPKSSLGIDVRKIRVGQPNQAVIAYSDVARLSPMGTRDDVTRVIVVTKPTGSRQGMILPVRVIDKKKGGNDENE